MVSWVGWLIGTGRVDKRFFRCYDIVKILKGVSFMLYTVCFVNCVKFAPCVFAR